MNRHALRALALTLPSLLALPAHANVEPGHWSVSHNGSTDVRIWVNQTIGGDYTESVLVHDSAANTLRLLAFSADEGSELFLVNPGDVLSSDTIASLPASAGLTWGGIPTVGEDFYMGVRTGSYTDPGFQWGDRTTRTTFGWAHFREDASGRLVIVDSAMAFRAPGIVVGSLQAVPEPTTWALFLCGFIAVAGLCQQRRQTSA
jgi:hypothetical protein